MRVFQHKLKTAGRITLTVTTGVDDGDGVRRGVDGVDGSCEGVFSVTGQKQREKSNGERCEKFEKWYE